MGVRGCEADKDVKEKVKRQAGLLRWKKQIFCVAAGLILGGAAAYGETQDCVRQGYVERGGYGDEEITYELVVEGLDDKPVVCTVDIEPLAYTQEEAEREFNRILNQLPALILGDNGGLDQVTEDLNLVTLFDGTGIRAAWQSRDPDIVDSFGHIVKEGIPEEGVEAVLEVVLTDGRFEREGIIPLVVRRPVKSGREEAAAGFVRQVQEADRAHPQEIRVTLPAEHEGRFLRFRRAGSRDYLVLPLLGVAGAFLLWGQEKAEGDRKRKQRRQLLLLDYADVVYQLMVYIGAGLTVERAWEQMVEDYEKEQATNPGHVRPAYEEMTVTLNQIRNGEPEGRAISEFGRRCRLQPYMKLSSLLEQNRRTGTKNLQQLLEQEMMSAWDGQKHTARRMGEEAKTKLLAPLFLMLLVVMVIIMVPAMMAVND